MTSPRHALQKCFEVGPAKLSISVGEVRLAHVKIEEYTSPFAATAVKRLNQSGAIILGKTNMDEFGMGYYFLLMHNSTNIETDDSG